MANTSGYRANKYSAPYDLSDTYSTQNPNGGFQQLKKRHFGIRCKIFEHDLCQGMTKVSLVYLDRSEIGQRIMSKLSNNSRISSKINLFECIKHNCSNKFVSCWSGECLSCSNLITMSWSIWLLYQAFGLLPPSKLKIGEIKNVTTSLIYLSRT